MELPKIEHLSAQEAEERRLQIEKWYNESKARIALQVEIVRETLNKELTPRLTDGEPLSKSTMKLDARGIMLSMIPHLHSRLQGELNALTFAKNAVVLKNRSDSISLEFDQAADNKATLSDDEVMQYFEPIVNRNENNEVALENLQCKDVFVIDRPMVLQRVPVQPVEYSAEIKWNDITSSFEVTLSSVDGENEPVHSFSVPIGVQDDDQSAFAQLAPGEPADTFLEMTGDETGDKETVRLAIPSISVGDGKDGSKLVPITNPLVTVFSLKSFNVDAANEQFGVGDEYEG